MTKDKSLIQSCVDHINTAIDVDPWAKELVAEMGKEILEQLKNSNDCISRQAAIDALTEYGNGRAVYISVEEAVRRIEQLLSAQPEIINCKDCKWFGDIGCAILIVDDSDKPKENDFCSFAERRADG